MSPTPGDSRSGLPIPLIRQGSTIPHMQQRVNNSPGGQVLNYSHNKHLREGTPQGLSREASPGSSLGSLLTLVPTGNSGHVSMKPGLSNSLQTPPGDREQGVLPAVVGSAHHEALQQQQQALHQQAYHQQVWSIVSFLTPAVVTGSTCFHLPVHRHRPFPKVSLQTISVQIWINHNNFVMKDRLSMTVLIRRLCSSTRI